VARLQQTIPGEVMSNYDDPVNHAKRLLTYNKDQPWAQKELAELVPLLLEEIERLEDQAHGI
jgi:uncharacterized small protein (DUF1192 family)